VLLLAAAFSHGELSLLELVWFPGDIHVCALADKLITYLVAGLVLAAIVKPPKKSNPTEQRLRLQPRLVRLMAFDTLACCAVNLSLHVTNGTSILAPPKATPDSHLVCGLTMIC